jgi:hypothetical protein
VARMAINRFNIMIELIHMKIKTITAPKASLSENPVVSKFPKTIEKAFYLYYYVTKIDLNFT